MKIFSKSRAFAIFVVAMSIYLFFYNEKLKVGQYDILTSKLFPRIICAVLMFLGFLLLFFGKDEKTKKNQSEKNIYYLNVVFFLFFSFLFLLSINYFGFLISSIIYLLIFTFMLAGYQFNLINILKITSFSIISCYVIHIVFQNYLYLMLP